MVGVSPQPVALELTHEQVGSLLVGELDGGFQLHTLTDSVAADEDPGSPRSSPAMHQTGQEIGHFEHVQKLRHLG